MLDRNLRIVARYVHSKIKISTYFKKLIFQTKFQKQLPNKKNFQRNANRVKYEEFKKSIEHLPKDERMQKMKEFKMKHQPQRRQRAN